MRRLFEDLARSVALCATLGACATAGGTGGAGGGSPAPAPQATASQDTSGIVPAGYGSLRQDDISVRVSHLGLTVQAMPLDEDILRTLAPDSYRNLVALRESKRPQLDSLARRAGLQSVDVWLVKFFNQQQGTAPFAPRDMTLSNMGRDYQPIDVIGISVGFGDNRVRQGESAQGLLVFDSSLNPNQPITIRLETETSSEWQNALKRIEAERSLIRSRAIKGRGTQEW